MSKAKSNLHAKHLLGLKAGSEKVAGKIMSQYQNKSKDREEAEKYFVFKKDGFMTSKPYQHELLTNKSSNVFD